MSNPDDVTSTDSDDENADSWQRLDPNYVQAERFGDIIFVSILSVIGLIVWLVLMFAVFSPTELRVWLIGLGGLAFIGLLGYWGWYHPQWHFNTTRWREIHRGFEIRRGIWWWHRIFIPRERIQHTDVVRGPIMRRFGIAKLVIYTAGSHNHEVSLDGLNAQQAESLRQSLLPQSSYLAPVKPIEHSPQPDQVVMSSEPTS